MPFDERQQKAITFGEGPVLVLAGPGTGKTYVITNRINYLIKNMGISPDSILVITFTKAAASSMESRYQSISNDLSQGVVFGTFHSVYYRFQKKFMGNKTPKIIDVKEEAKILSLIISAKKDNSEVRGFSKNAIVEDMINAISKYKTSNSFPLEYSETFFLSIYEEYKNYLHETNKMDYEDILICCRDLLLNDEYARNTIRNQFSHILIDEFQDINGIQYEILKLISNINIFAVGDEDQSIYGFRGSNPEIMKKFLKDFPNTTIVELNHNFRSTKQIVSFSGKVISKNENRIKKDNLVSFDNIVDSINIITFGSKDEQKERIIEIIKEANKNNKSIAVLMRTNKGLAEYRKYISNSVYKNYSNNEHLRQDIFMDFYNYVNACLTMKRSYFEKILNKPERMLPLYTLQKEEVDFDRLIRENAGNYKASNLQNMKRQFDMLKKSSPFPFCIFLRRVVGYEEFIKEHYPKEFKSEISDILNEIEALAKSSQNLLEFSNKLKIEPVRDVINEEIIFLTYHGSKGLEFDYVILPDVIEGIIPSRINLNPTHIEEERRLFYVALTRARKKLFIFTAKKEESTSMLPSRFINEFI